MNVLVVGLLIAAVAVAWRAYDDYRDRVKERARLAEFAELERVCREQRDKQLGITPLSSRNQKRAA